ncbi:MAG: helix-turn-helix domain-containing protein [Cyanobacteria bacterium P01_G01_bin.39]
MLHIELTNNSSVPEVSERSQLLTPFERQLLQSNLNKDSRPEYRRRIEIMLLADLGKSQSEICAVLNCSNETARYWITMAKAGQAHQWNSVPIGRPKRVSDQYIERLQELVSYSPQEFGYGFHRWTARWLSKHLAQEFAIEISDRHINRLLKKMGLSTRSQSSSKDLNKQGGNGLGLVIEELNNNSKSNYCCLGPY